MPTPDLYFALIHARTSIPNQWVDAFYHRLDLEVQSRAVPTPGLRAGSLYFPTAGDARRGLAAEPPRVRVLVPLYTREFLHDPPPDFGDRLHHLDDPGEQPFVHPVLWEPHLPARRVNGLAQAVSLGDAAPEYLDCGMASICRLNAFDLQLRRIVEELADRVVTAAETPERTPTWLLNRPVPRWPVPPQRSPEPRFPIIVIRADWRDPDWQPYGAGPVAERARDTAQRYSLLTEVRTGTATDGLQDSAGVLLLDAGVLDDPRDRRAAEEFLRKAPRWMTVVMVIGTDHADRAHELAADARAMVPNGLQIARDSREFQRAVDEAVPKARRNFLRSRQPRGSWEDSR